MRIDSYPLLDAFCTAIAMYLMFLLIWRLQGREDVKNTPFIVHVILTIGLWIFWTFCAVCNATEKSTIVLGTIIIVVGITILFLAFFTNVFQSLGKSTDLARMIQKYKGDYLNPQIIPELYLYCCKHKLLNPIVHRYKANVRDFALIYLYLLAKCRVSYKGHFIPISTFFFAASLDYVLAKKDRLGCDDIFWLKRYFGLPAESG